MGAAAATSVSVDGLDVPADEYGKLYKKLGNRNANKDVRQQIQHRLHSNLENEVSSNFQQNVNPGYQFDNGMSTTTNRVNLNGDKS